MALIDKNAIRREVERKDAERTPAVRQWDRLPAGTRVSTRSGAPAMPFAYSGGGEAVRGIFFEQNGYRIDPTEFANASKRDTLAKLGFFSVDDPAHRARRIEQAYQEALRAAAAEALGIDRPAAQDRIAASLAARTPEGIWPTSTIEYVKRREALDTAILYAAGVTDHG